LSFFCLSVPSHAQPIYKWIDENGNVHYSDRPDPNVQAEQLFIKPVPESLNSEEPNEAIKRMQATSNELEASRQQRETVRAKEEEKHRQEREQSAKKNEPDNREPNRHRWYSGRHPQRPLTQPPVQLPIKPAVQSQPPTAVLLSSQPPVAP